MTAYFGESPRRFDRSHDDLVWRGRRLRKIASVSRYAPF